MSSKIDDFHFIEKAIYDSLSIINSYLGPILHSLADIARNGPQGHPKLMTGFLQVFRSKIPRVFQ